MSTIPIKTTASVPLEVPGSGEEPHWERGAGGAGRSLRHAGHGERDSAYSYYFSKQVQKTW